MAVEPDSHYAPRCVASTDTTFGGLQNAPEADDAQASIFKTAQWSPDGTCVVTSNDDRTLRTYVIPPDLLTNLTPHHLKPYSTILNPTHTYAFSLYPGYSLSNPATTFILSSILDHPIRLHNALYPKLEASYKLIDPNTERYIPPHSITFTRWGTHFVTGSESLLCVFDISRSFSDPITRLPTIPSRRKKLVGGGVGIKGIVGALGVSKDGLLAAGTFTRCVGLYADEGEGDTVGVFSVAGEEGGGADDGGIGGSGVTQCLWSPCGRYLYVVERKSDGALLYDVRVTGKKLGFLTGRKALTNQRLGVEVVALPGEDGGYKVCAGGTDGVVRVWKNPHLMEGSIPPETDWKLHDDAVSSATMHPTANVLATCSGHWDFSSPSDITSSSSGDKSESSSQRKADASASTEKLQPVQHDRCMKLWTF